MIAEPARLDIENLTVSYNGSPALDNLTLQIPVGARVAVVGPNGAGKSTLFKVLVGELPIQSGSINIHCQPLGHHQDCVAYVPQREEVDWHFPLTVEDVVMMGRYGRLGWLRRVSQHDQMIVSRSLSQVGIEDLAQHAILDLSGGQQQRVFMARALAQEPHILLLDEPFNGIDAPTQEAIFSLLDDMHHQAVTAIVSTHDLNLAAKYFDLVILLNKKLIAFGSPQSVFTHHHVRQAFTDRVMMIEGHALIDDCCPPNETNHRRRK